MVESFILYRYNVSPLYNNKVISVKKMLSSSTSLDVVKDESIQLPRYHFTSPNGSTLPYLYPDYQFQSLKPSDFVSDCNKIFFNGKKPVALTKYMYLYCSAYSSQGILLKTFYRLTPTVDSLKEIKFNTCSCSSHLILYIFIDNLPLFLYFINNFF